MVSTTPKMLTNLDHVVIAVRNLRAASEQYSSLLGRRPSWRGRHPGHGTANTLFQLDNTYVELLAADEEGPLASLLRERLEARGEGLYALAFGSDDAERAVATLRGRGLAVGDPAEGSGRDETSGAIRRWRSAFLSPAEARGVQLFLIQHLSPAEMLPDAAATSAVAATIAAVDHVVIQTSAADDAVKLYGERLGIRLALDRSFPDWGTRLLFFRIGGVTVEVAAALAGTDGAAEGSAADRLWGISWRTNDVAAAHARLAGEGFDVSEVRTGRRPGTRVFTVRGEPCGVATLVLGPDPDAPPR